MKVIQPVSEEPELRLYGWSRTWVLNYRARKYLMRQSWPVEEEELGKVCSTQLISRLWLSPSSPPLQWLPRATDEGWGLGSLQWLCRTTYPRVWLGVSTPQLVYNLTSLLTHETSTTVSFSELSRKSPCWPHALHTGQRRWHQRTPMSEEVWVSAVLTVPMSDDIIPSRPCLMAHVYGDSKAVSPPPQFPLQTRNPWTKLVSGNSVTLQSQAIPGPYWFSVEQKGPTSLSWFPRMNLASWPWTITSWESESQLQYKQAHLPSAVARLPIKLRKADSVIRKLQIEKKSQCDSSRTLNIKIWH